MPRRRLWCTGAGPVASAAPFRVVFLALGTRGDVQPLLAVADHWLATAQAVVKPVAVAGAGTGAGDEKAAQSQSHALWRNGLEVVFATHLELHAVLQPYSLHGVQFRAIRSPCFRRPIRAADTYGASTTTATADSEADSDSDGGGDPDASWSAALSAETRRIERADALAACGGAALIAFNLFALNAYHIAELMAVPAIALSPYAMPDAAPPASFARTLQRDHSQLFAALKGAAAARRTATGAAGAVPAAWAVSWDEVVHWMWPLFADDAYREQYLTLAPLPFCVPETDAVCDPLPPVTPLLYGLSPSAFPRPGYWPTQLTATAAAPPPTTEAVASDGRGDAPIAMTGFWFSPQPKAFALPAGLEAFLQCPTGRGSDVVYIGFGSMGAIGLVASALCAAVARALIAALQACGLRAVVLASSFAAPPTDREPDAEAEAVERVGTKRTAPLAVGDGDGFDFGAFEAGPKRMRSNASAAVGVATANTTAEETALTAIDLWERAAATGSAYVLRTDVPHMWLFARCGAVVHHGGSGTTAAALAAGVPQLVVPLAFDQFANAQHVAWCGVGPQPMRMPKRYNPSAAADPEPDADTDGDSVCDAQALVRRLKLMLPVASAATVTGQAVALPRTAMQVAAAELAQRIRSEPNGCAEAVARLTRFAEARCSPQRSGAAPQYHVRPPQRMVLDQKAVVRAGGSAPATAHANAKAFAVYALSPSETVFLFDEIFTQSVYFRCGMALREDAVVIDVGANTGLFTLCVAHRLSRYRVIACEPLTPIAQCFRQNMALHGVPLLPTPPPSNSAVDAKTSATASASAKSASASASSSESGVHFHCVGLSDAASATAAAPFVYFPNAAGNSSRELHRLDKEQQLMAADEQADSPLESIARTERLLAGATVHSAPLTTLSALLRAYDAVAVAVDSKAAATASASESASALRPVSVIDVLKIDVEGEEARVLDGIDCAEHWARIAAVTMEVMDVRGRLKYVVELLTRKGFDVSVSDMSSMSIAGNFHVYATRKVATTVSASATASAAASQAS